ncbi:hypothetical protein STEG23_020142 [Scotinomys teguina]
MSRKVHKSYTLYVLKHIEYVYKGGPLCSAKVALCQERYKAMLEVVISPSLAASSDCKESLTWSEDSAAVGALSDREGWVEVKEAEES